MNIEKMLSECRAHWEKTRPDSVFADYWLGWQASREFLVIELPSLSGMNSSFVADGIQITREHNRYNTAVKDCRKAIEAAGLKVKP